MRPLLQPFVSSFGLPLVMNFVVACGQPTSEDASLEFTSVKTHLRSDVTSAGRRLDELKETTAPGVRPTLSFAAPVDYSTGYITARVKSLFLCECLTREHRAPVVHAAAA
jgi:hypothetical protein